MGDEEVPAPFIDQGERNRDRPQPIGVGLYDRGHARRRDTRRYERVVRPDRDKVDGEVTSGLGRDLTSCSIHAAAPSNTDFGTRRYSNTIRTICVIAAHIANMSSKFER